MEPHRSCAEFLDAAGGIGSDNQCRLGGGSESPLFDRQSTQLHEWHQHTAVAIMLGNVKVAGFCVDEIKLVTVLAVVTRCKPTFATGKERPLQLRFRHKISDLIMVEGQHRLP